jgi:rhodanese-related sulfurtransferase
MSVFQQLAALFGAAEPVASGYQRITPPAARELLAGDARARLVDVRSEGEYREQHIDGSVLIPHTVIVRRAPALLPDRDAPVVVYCQSGMRSRAAADALLALGYTQVYDLGSIMRWPYGTVSG